MGGRLIIMISVWLINLSIELCNILFPEDQDKARWHIDNDISDRAEKSSKKYDFLSLDWHNLEESHD